MMLRIIAAFALFCVFFASPVEARHRKPVLDPSCNIFMPCIAPMSNAQTIEHERVTRGRYISNELGFGGVAPRRYRHVSELVAHPAGCPARAFCGCGAVERLKHTWGVVLARPRDLWLAANWFRFPRTYPAPGMVAVRRHHVFVLEQHLEGLTWIAYDANSGRHATQIHARSIAGYVIVDPRA